VLPVLVLAALAVLPANAPLTDLPAGADPCVALTPAVVDQLRTSGALTPLVPDDIPTSTLIRVGRSLTGCSPAGDPDPSTIQRQVCPFLTAEGVDALANIFRATPAVRADLGPERIAIARNALECDHPAATASEGITARPERGSSNTVDRADRGVLHGPAVIAIAAAIAALIGVLLLILVVLPRRRQPEGRGGASKRPQVLQPLPGAPGSGGQRIPADGDRGEGQQRSGPASESDMRGGPEDRSDSYDELLEGLRREVTELQRADEPSRKRSTEPDDHGGIR
jgi:hypothetical protein